MPFRAVMIVPAIACAVAAADPPHQRHLCRGWIPTEAASDRTGNVYAVASLDPDGAGPKTQLLLFGSRGWDGRRYQNFPTGHVDEIRTMTWADLDGAGPGTAALYGASTPLANYERSVVYSFSGTGWQSISSSVSGSWPTETLINAITPFDPDGAGPSQPNLYAGGTFTTPGAYLMRWDGLDWFAVPTSPINAPVHTLTTFDPDGPGPTAPRLIVGGAFQNAGSSNGDHIVQWTGTSWQALGIGLNGGCSASVVFDPDGGGPLNPRLYVGGSFTAAGGQPVGFVAQWNGTSWSGLGSGVNGPVDSLLVIDPDGNGPQPERLVASGNFTVAGGITAEYAAQWNGSTWSTLGSQLDGKVYGAVLHDPDQDGPAEAAAALCGTFSTVGAVELGDPAMWNGSEWYGITNSLSDTARAVVLFDPDGTGGEPPRPIAGGDFNRAGYLRCSYIAQRVGLHWRPVAEGVDGPVSSLLLYQGAVIAGGSFTTAGTQSANYVARWDGAAWSPLGSGLDGPVTAMSVYDPDGSGPGGPRLVVGGIFTTAGGVGAAYIASWNGSAWSPLGPGLNGPVNAIAAFDPDGDGPQGDSLMVAGEFTTAGGVAVDRWAQWTGSTWLTMGPAPGAIYALTSFDFDGPGPSPSTVYAGGELGSGNGFVAEVVGDWWYPLGEEFDGPVRALICMDPDDAEYLPPVLIAGGPFTANSIEFTRGMASWEGGAWINMAGGVEGAALAFGVGFDHDGAGLATHPVLTVGDFSAAGQKPGCRFGLYSFGGEPSVPLPPRDTVGHFGASVSLPIEAEGLLPVQYHWMKGEEFILDGGTPWGGTYTGTQTNTLTISGLAAGDAGEYNCYVTSACGNSFSTPGVVTVTCPADINGDGFVDGIDYDTFNNDFEAGNIEADFNRDGFVDGIDYDEFNNAFEAGC